VKVSSLAIFPVKGCRAVDVERAVVSHLGLAGDREWQVVGADRQPLTQRTHPRLALVQPTIIDGGVRLQAEGMPDLDVERPQVADTDAFSLIEPVRLGDAGSPAAAWFAELLEDGGVRLLAIAAGYERKYPFFRTSSALGDVAPIVLASDASHEYLAARAKEPFGRDRWRLNLFVDGAEPFAEDGWRTLRIGETTVSLVYPWPRCSVPQVDQRTGERHREPAVVLKQHRWCTEAPEDADGLIRAILPGNGLFAMAGSIEPVGGSIAVGDEVEVLERAAPVLPFSPAG